MSKKNKKWYGGYKHGKVKGDENRRLYKPNAVNVKPAEWEIVEAKAMGYGKYKKTD